MRTTATRFGLVTGLAVGSLVLAGCSTPAEGDGAAEQTVGSIDLAAAGCPSTVGIQTDWNPEAEHGHLYELIGDGYTVDSENKTVTGPLVASGEYTGVDVTVYSGGPATGFTQPNFQMYADESDSILLAYVGTDEAIAQYSEVPTVGIFAPLEKDPQMIMWDPETYPDVEGIADLGEEGVTVRVFPGGTYIDYFVGAGILSQDQVDATYDGAPAVFVSEGGAIAQQGFASAEPYIYENEVGAWGKPVDYQLINDAGYPKYAAVLSTKPENIDEYSDCFSELVPVLQQASLDYYADPAETNELVLELVDAYDTGWIYGPEVAEYSVETQLSDGIIGNGANDVYGDLDPERVQELFDKVTPIYEEQGFTIPADLTPESIYTNQFIDESISFEN